MSTNLKRNSEDQDGGSADAAKRHHTQQVKVEDTKFTLGSGGEIPSSLGEEGMEYTNLKATSSGSTGEIPASSASSNSRTLGPGTVNNGKRKSSSSAGHRPVTSCTHCRQHKIKCNASEKFPAPCTRCQRMGLHCEIDPQFRPKKGSQLQSLRNDVDELKVKIEYLTRNESLIAKALKQSNMGQNLLQTIKGVDFSHRVGGSVQPHNGKGKVSVQTYLTNEPQLLQDSQATTTANTRNNSKANTPPGPDNSSGTTTLNHHGKSALPQLLNDSVPTNNTKDGLPPVLQMALKRLNQTASNPSQTNSPTASVGSPQNMQDSDRKPIVATTNAMPLLPSPHANIDEFVLGDVRISIARANELHDIFVSRFLPYFPIMQSNSATELYSQSQLLFWTVMLTASLSDPEPVMYNKLASLIKQLAIETCWIRTPRSTHISQALLILCTWPLPNQKVLDDCSYRFVGLAKSLSYQLGLHRGKFMTEFTRTQTSMPDAEKWRTRTWLGIFFAEQLWASILGLPPTSQTDYLIEKARLGDDGDLPKRFRKLICLANFQAKLVNVMGSSVVSPDGLMDARERAGSLSILERELQRLDTKLKFDDDIAVEIYFLYTKLMICCFAFLPETPTEDQTKYVTEAYLSSTRIITLLTKLLESQTLIELPIYIRHSATYSALILFKLYLTPLLLDKYVDSARQSIVTVHRLYRNQLTAWTTCVENDISRTASVLEKLNFVLVTHPDVFIEEDGIVSRMRSHLTGTLFYDLVWCVHEARRRQVDPSYDAEASKRNKEKGLKMKRKLYPLPFYNQISKEDFEAITQTTPGGTTVTTLVPTKNAIRQAKHLAKLQGDRKGPITHINGIPISMLDETGSVNIEGLLNNAGLGISHSQPASAPNGVAPGPVNLALNGSSQISANTPSMFSHTVKKPSSSTVVENSTLTSNYPSSKRTVSKTSASIITGDPNSLFSMNNSLQANIQLNKTLSAENISTDNNKPNKTIKLGTDTRSPTEPYSNLNIFYNGSNGVGNIENNIYQPAIGTTGSSLVSGLTAQSTQQDTQSQQQPNQNSELDDFFLRQSAGWIEGNSSNDDFLGWFDINMAPEF